jgi:hypothetical protein
MSIRKILSISAIIGLPFITLFSQQNCGLRIDTAKRFILNYNSSKNYLKNIDPNNYRIQFPTENYEKIFDFRANHTFRTIDHMICIKPKGYYPMKILRPDSTHRL